MAVLGVGKGVEDPVAAKGEEGVPGPLWIPFPLFFLCSSSFLFFFPSLLLLFSFSPSFPCFPSLGDYALGVLGVGERGTMIERRMSLRKTAGRGQGTSHVENLAAAMIHSGRM